MKNHLHGMRSIPLVLALGASATGCATGDLDDADLGTQQNEIIGGGNVSEQNRHDMALVDVTSSRGICSGSLFDTNWVITATHCIDFNNVSGNTFGVPRAPIASGIETRRARRPIQMDQSDLTLVELEPIPDISQGLTIWPTITRRAYAGSIDALKNTSMTCYGRGGSGYQGDADGGLTSDGWHNLTRVVTDITDGVVHVTATGNPGSQIPAPGDSGGLCTGANGIEAVISAGSWRCADGSTDDKCKASITSITGGSWLVTQPWAGIINAIAGKKPLGVWNDTFSDGSGWNGGPEYYSTIQYPDVTGDGRADVCGRAGSGIRCAVSTNDTGFTGTRLWESSFSDGNGWNSGPEYYSTIRFPDVNGDGKADVCGRGNAGIWCATSTGSSFTGIAQWDSMFSDGNGWRDPKYYSTLHFADVNGDGKADVCGRGGLGIYCALSTGTGFTTAKLWVADFDDARGWDSPEYYSTIQLADVNGDGKADVCGRASSGIHCALSNGSAFSARRRWNDFFSDANGWNGGPEYYSTIRFPDVNGDGKADVCGRGTFGISCALSSGSAFVGTTLWLANFTDAFGWNSGPEYYSTIRFTDLDADGRMDVCGRGGAGVYCAASNGSSFAGFTLWDDNMSDANGWNAAPYYSTIGFPDIDTDFHTELCGRGGAGIYCEK